MTAPLFAGAFESQGDMHFHVYEKKFTSRQSKDSSSKNRGQNSNKEFKDGKRKYFHKSISNRMAALHRNITTLTEDQCRILRELRLHSRVRIQGCAGSGKTLVAAEKSIRLANANVKTMFLCHNPLLAQHVKDLTRGSRVMVWTFTEWVNYINYGASDAQLSDWTNYDEPLDDEIIGALAKLEDFRDKFRAIIVDEGQDFREKWWDVVMASLDDKNHDLLYIFHDDHQALLPYRSNYPIESHPIDLSRNCRNSGRVFDLVNHFHRQAPEPEVGLINIGHVWLIQSTIGNEYAAIRKLLRQLKERGLFSLEKVLLFGGGLHIKNWPYREVQLDVLPTNEHWQSSVSSYFRFACSSQNSSELRMEPDSINIILSDCGKFSNNATPDAKDIEIVCKWTKMFHVALNTRKHIRQYWHPKNYLQWRVHNEKLLLRRRNAAPLLPAEVIMFFEDEKWAETLPTPEPVHFVMMRRAVQDNEIAVFDLAAFKGLESDLVILVIGGYQPIRIDELYVGVSRARFGVGIINCGTRLDIPSNLIDVTV